MRRLTTPSHVMSLKPESVQLQQTLNHGRADQSSYRHRSHDSLISHLLEHDEQLWTNIPVPSIADPDDPNLVRPKTLLDCCQCAQEFLDEYDLNDGYEKGKLSLSLLSSSLMRVYGHRTRMLTQLQSLHSAAERNDPKWYLWSLVNILRLVF